MLSCVIIDDENKARILLRNMLASIGANVQILADCNNLAEGIKAIRNHKPNIVFLDIEMPMQSGIEILNYFTDDEVDFEIVFTTGFSEYALQAFKLSATDYLLKPINPVELKATIERIVARYEKNALATYKALYQNLSISKDAEDKCITIFLNNATRFVKLKDIVMLQADGAYTLIYTQTGEKLMASRNLKYFEERLDPYSQFMRCQKSYVININKVLEFSKTEGEIKLENNLIAQISIDKHDLFLEKMKTC
jgi:two-component system, LytTR family, response regulator